MRPTRIEGADPLPLGAPKDWDPDKHGRIGGLFVRREIIGGIHYMRSAWELEEEEALLLLAGGQQIIGVQGHEHPVLHLGIQPPPEDAQPVYVSRRTVGTSGLLGGRVDAVYPHGGGRRCYAEIILSDDEPFARACGRAMDMCDELARQQGWMV